MGEPRSEESRPEGPDMEAGAGQGPASGDPASAGHEPSGPSQLAQLGDLLLFLPRLAVLIGKLIADAEVAATDKLLLGGAILYIASPLDIIPDFVPVIGQLDDIYLVALCLLRLMNRSGEAKLRQHWDGPEDIVKVLQLVSEVATRYLPAPVRGAVRGWVEARDGKSPPPQA